MWAWPDDCGRGGRRRRGRARRPRRCGGRFHLSAGGPRGRLRHRLRRLAIDVSPLADSRDFRFLFAGQVVNQIGSQIRIVALPYQVFLLTGSSAAVGLLSLVQFFPFMVLSLVGGTLADARDRRRILFLTQALLAVTSALLAAGTLLGHASLPFLFAVAAAAAGVSAFDQPARRAAIPRLVPRERLASAFALNQAMSQFSSVLGPALGGVILATLGIGPAYLLDVLGFVAAILSLLPIAPLPPEAPQPGAPRRTWHSIREGLEYLRGKPVLISALFIDLDAMLFGSPRALFPALATNVFRTGPAGLGLLYAAPAAGGLVAALSGGWLGRVRRQGRAVIGAVLVWGLAIAGFGFATRSFAAGLGLLAVAGAADMISAVLRNTILQTIVPDRLRGRLSSVHLMFVSGGPRLGDAEAGVVAAATGVEFSIVSGGLASVIGAVCIAWALPAFARYDAAALEA